MNHHKCRLYSFWRAGWALVLLAVLLTWSDPLAGADAPNHLREQKSTAAPSSARPTVTRIGTIYSPEGSGSRHNQLKVVADVAPGSPTSLEKVNLDEIRSGATLVCIDCDHTEKVAASNASYFSDLDEGITLIVAVDAGSGMAGQRMASVRQGLQRIFKSKRPNDRIAVVAIGKDLHTIADFRTSDNEASNSIALLHPESVAFPSLYRGLVKTLDLFDQAGKDFPQRRRLLIVSTGRNEASGQQSAAGGFRDDDVIARARQARVVVDCVSIPVPLPPKTITVADQKFQMPSEQSAEAYVEALEKIVRATGGLYLRQNPAKADLGEGMNQCVQWLRATPVLLFDLKDKVPQDGKEHHLKLQLSNQPDKELDLTISLPSRGASLRVSPGLILFIGAVLVFCALIVFRGGPKPGKHAAVEALENESQSEAPQPVIANSESREVAVQRGHTLKEGVGPSRYSTAREDLFEPYQDGRAEWQAAVGPSDRRPSRSATRIFSSCFPEPGPESPCCTLRILSGACAGTAFPIKLKEVTLGREQNRNTIALPDPSISSHHATLRWNSGVVTITDENSTNGTSVGGVRLTSGVPYPLQLGNHVHIGSTVLAIEQPQECLWRI